MRNPGAQRPHGRDRRRTGAPGPVRADLDGTEDFYLRNYDEHAGYELTLVVRDTAGDVVIDARYSLRPGQVERERSVLSSGEYRITVGLDDRQAAALRCRIDSSPANTAVIEVGNAALSLTTGPGH